MANTDIEIGLGSLTSFLAASSSSARMEAVRQAVQTYETDYDPRNDFYKRIRTALETSVATSSDDPLDLAVQAATQTKRGHYIQIADGWRRWQPRRKARPTAERATWSVGGMTLKVTPLLITTVSKQEVLTLSYLRAPDLANDAAQAITRITELAFNRPPGSTGVLDVRRFSLVRGRARRIRNYDDWLEAEVASFEGLFRKAQQAA